MTVPEHRICLVEDDPIMGEALTERFRIEGFDCDWLRDGDTARQRIASGRYALVISDIRLPGLGGEDLYRALRAEPGLQVPPFIFITGFGTVDVAVRLVKAGARDYLSKPVDILALLRTVREICQEGESAMNSPSLGVSPAMRAIAAMLPRVAENAGTVLITGESGVGKEEVARALHRQSDPGEHRPFVAVNCGALTESLLEAELFGYTRGSFTGATRDKKGMFELANGGTLFLDEIGDMSMAMQVRLLRVIQERQVRRIGADAVVPVSIMLVCATHRDLRKLVEQGGFREDLYYRIHVIHLHVAPLRERREDILWLARRMLDLWGSQHNERRTLDSSAERALLAHSWPGNVRELKHCLERACIMHGSPVLEARHLFDLPDEVPSKLASVSVLARHSLPLPAPGPETDLDSGEPGTLGAFVQACERKFILRTLHAHDGRIASTAEQLGISRKNLWEKMKKLQIGG